MGSRRIFATTHSNTKSPIYVVVAVVFLLLPEILIVGATLLSARWPAFVLTRVMAAAVMGFQFW